MTAPGVVGVVAPNGTGHLVRVLDVLERRHARLPGVTLGVVCTAAQEHRVRSRYAALQVRYVVDAVDCGVAWHVDARRYDDGRLTSWVAALREVRDVTGARLVISDNLAQVLTVRPDARLLGSFLWSDVLAAAHPASTPVRAFAAEERSLLAEVRPPMLCVGDVVMPGVLARTAAVPLGWLCRRTTEPPVATDTGRPVVGIFAGGTQDGPARFAPIVEALADEPRWLVAHDPDLARGGVPTAAVRDGAGLTVAVCRPGLGTVTTCVAAGVPMLLAHEPGHPELEHVADRLEALGVARRLGDRDVRATVADLLRPEVRAPMLAALRGLDRTGLDAATDVLAAALRQAVP